MSGCRSCAAVDVHAHIGDYRSGGNDLMDRFCTAGPEMLVERARGTGIGLTFVSALGALMLDEGSDGYAGNLEAVRAAEAFPDDLRFWAVLNPERPRTVDQARELLSHPGCVGIKIHPVQHSYEIRERGDGIFEFAAEHSAIVQSHSGEPGSWPMDFVPFADRYPTVQLILSHLGCGADGKLDHQVRAVKAAKHRNIWTDTSSQTSILPGLIEWAVQEIGSDRVLFGTDSPCYFSAAQHARITHAEIDDGAKQAILRGNATRLFGLSEA